MTMDTVIGGPAVYSGRALFSPRATWVAGALEVNAALEAGVDSLAGARVSVAELTMRLALADWGALTLGRFLYKPGTALLFSNVDYFTSLDLGRLLSEGVSAPGRPDDMVQLRLFGGLWHASATFSPWRPRSDPTPTASPWFPRGGIKDSFQVLTTTYTLRNLSWRDDSADPWPVIDPAVELETGFVLGPLDLSLSWFDGPDRESAVIGQITMPVSPWGVYDITLQEVSSRINREGLAASVQAGDFRAWGDTSLFQGKLLQSGDLYSAVDGWLTGTRAKDGLDLTVGLSYTPPWPNSLVGLECRYSWYAGDVTGLTFPLLSRVVAAEVTSSLFGETVAVSVIGLCSLDDRSWAFLPSASFSLGPDRTLQFWVPLLFGPTGSEPGQYAPLALLMTSFRVRY